MALEDSAPPRASNVEAPTALPDGSSVVGDENQADNVLKEEESWEVQRQKIPLRVDVEWLDFEHFKNRYTEKEGMAIIEVLVGHSQIAQEVSREAMRRARGKRDIRTPTPNPKLVVDEDSYWMQRVRIQSPQLVLLLSRLTGHRNKWSTGKSRTFFAPFRCFYHYLQQLKECLKLLEAHWPAGEAPTSATPSTSSISQTEAKNDPKRDGLDGDPGINRGSDNDDDELADLGPMAPEMAVAGDVIDSHVTLAHLTRFVDFIEKHIVPLWHRAAGTSQRKFRFSDLWMAFQPGELLHSLPPNTEKGRSTKIYQTAWRLLTLVSDPLADDRPDDTQKTTSREFDVYAYYIDYNGISYVPVRHTFTIKHFEGERDITTLDVYPLRFIKDGDRIKDTLREQGTWFRQAITEKHLFCDGWTLTCGPTGNPSESGGSLAVEHIDGDVIIDFVEGYKSEPSLVSFGPSSWNGLGNFSDSDWPEGDDNLGIMHWKPLANSARLERFVEIREKTQRGEWYDERIKSEQVNGRGILKNLEEGKRTEDLDGEDLLLLPCRVVAYTFRERRFVMLDIQSLKSLPTSDDVFNDLKIDPSHRMMVVSLVKSHLEKQAAQKLRPSISMNQDLIRGKGSGLVILLHGVPGVGKTATAEAIAQTNKKPLFVITCGDLGFTPREVEDSLKDIFRLAHLWDCVLLLDEADIFLSRRELGDLKRNALVSVFLRVLEYYSGILFLTTNRVGTLDEAFKSRIHVSLYYPPLNKAQTIEIFKVNIRKLQEIMHEKEKLQAELDSTSTATSAERPPLAINPQSILHYAAWHYDINEESPEQRWNGRQIRNAFQIAYSLAQFEMNSNVLCQGGEAGDRLTPCPLPVIGLLNWRHFDMVAKAVEKFESYLYNATSGTDSDRARKAAIREDEYDYRTMPYKPVYNPPSRQWKQGVRRPGQNTASNPPPGHSRQYRPPRPASRDEQAPLVRNPQGRPEQRSLNGSSGGGPPRKNPNTGGLPGGPSSSTASPQYTHSRLPPGQTQPQQRQQPARATNINHPGNKVPGPATARRNNPGHDSGWDTNIGATAPSTPGAPGDWQGYVPYDSEDDLAREEDEGYGVGGGGNYEDDYYGNGEDDLDGVGDDRRYIDDGC
ncbi:hypothetical protein F4823DRAFT_58803 [Ustulina deusta]|nr:hypothetical protein F4823DRAFT_58803 [Ustulina deusta]